MIRRGEEGREEKLRTCTTTEAVVPRQSVCDIGQYPTKKDKNARLLRANQVLILR